MNLSRLLTRLVYLLERERRAVAVRLPPYGRTNGWTGDWTSGKGNAVARAPWEGRRTGQGGGCRDGWRGTTTAELSSLMRVYFSRDYKRS